MIEVTVNDITWVDVVSLALTALLIIGVVAAYLQMNRQIRQARDQHGEQLRASLRPLVIIPHVESRLTEGRPEFLAWLQNVGPGPAMSVEVLAWPRIPTSRPDVPNEWRQEVDRLRADVEFDSPALTARVGALAPGHEPRGAMLVPEVDVPIADYVGQNGVLVYIVKYQDVFENSFPSKPQAEWKAGHIAIDAQGSWSK